MMMYARSVQNTASRPSLRRAPLREKKFTQPRTIKFWLFGEIEPGDDRNDESSKQVRAYAEHTVDKSGNGKASALHVRQDQASEVGFLQACRNAFHRRISAADHLVQFGGDLSSEEVGSAAHHADQDQSRKD